MDAELHSLIEELEDLQQEMLDLEDENRCTLARLAPEIRASAANLLHYVALQRRDTSELEERLSALGVCSPFHTERQALCAVRTAIDVLARLRGVTRAREDCRAVLERNAEALLGAFPEGRNTRIMVTMPSEAATRYELVRDLLHSGMNCMRIDCAHDGEEAWNAMIRNLRRAELETGQPCKVQMDLAGPSLRTGTIERGPAVWKVRPKRDALGRLEQPARIWLTPGDRPETPEVEADACLPVPRRWIAGLKAGDEIRFTDTRGAKRCMVAKQKLGCSQWAECLQTSYLSSGMLLNAVSRANPRSRRRTHAGSLTPVKPPSLLLRRGDTLLLTRSLEPGHAPRFNAEQELIAPGRIGVTRPEFFDSARAGQPIWFDGGKIGGVLAEVRPDRALVQITHAKPEGSKLGEAKEICLPETDLETADAALNSADLQALRFAVQHADLVGCSFARTAQDVNVLQKHLEDLGAVNAGIVLKIDTRAAFENLPELLLAAMGNHRLGLMLGRDHLAMECGPALFADAKYEILQMANAAHVPVIWAAGTLDASSKRAACVVVNQSGAKVLAATQALDDNLRRSAAQRQEKISRPRKSRMAAELAGHAAVAV